METKKIYKFFESIVAFNIGVIIAAYSIFRMYNNDILAGIAVLSGLILIFIATTSIINEVSQ